MNQRQFKVRFIITICILCFALYQMLIPKFMKTPETFTAENEAFTVLISKEDDFYKVRITSNDSVPESLNPLPVAIMGRKGKSMVDTSLNLKSIPSDNRSYEGLYPSPYNGYEAKSIEIQLKDGNQTLSLQPVKPNED